MKGVELVFAPRLAHPSHIDRPTFDLPFQGGERRSFALQEVVRFGKFVRAGTFVTYAVAEVGGVLYVIATDGRSEEEGRELAKRMRKMGSASGRRDGYAVHMEDGQPPPVIRTLPR